MKIKFHEDYIRSAFFGLQDGLVSTTGVVVGISAGIHDKPIIVLASIVAISVEATSMAAGQYSSEKAVHQMDKSRRHNDNLFVGALIMFISYLGAGMIPVLPVIIFGPPISSVIGVIMALAGLFTIGYVKGLMIKDKPLRNALELLIIGGTATAIGLIVGHFLRI
jgi:VIT1/CCC1 family predicted Fe2+/Mn2+ transporter